MKNWLSNLFQTPSDTELAKRELAEAKRGLLEAQSAKEYAGAIELYNQSRIDRLKLKLQTE